MIKRLWDIKSPIKKVHVSLSYADVYCNITSNHDNTELKSHIDNRVKLVEYFTCLTVRSDSSQLSIHLFR